MWMKLQKQKGQVDLEVAENKLYQQIIKAIINWNGQNMIWDLNFLAYQDNFDLIITKEDDKTISLSTKLKKQ